MLDTANLVDPLKSCLLVGTEDRFFKLVLFKCQLYFMKALLLLIPELFLFFLYLYYKILNLISKICKNWGFTNLRQKVIYINI